ncbi:bestrophin family protein [Membranihabitans marinus]|uniref:bestrophin family protein n=1 Tax=Membranihabitans marinus TaxID=1227546 RepID=UPI001F1B0A64|nr:bestrophin family ion channel [Membranihabitans marinus]
MYAKRNYGFVQTFMWSKKPFILGVVYAILVQFGLKLINFSFYIPWQPISVIGIAVAFYLGFKNNSSYDRTWEARKIWGGIVNNSRTFGAAVVSFVQGEGAKDVQRELIYRHIAWLITLRHQLRLSRPWEHTELRLPGVVSESNCADYKDLLDRDLARYIEKSELEGIKSKSNSAVHIMANQSRRLQELRDLDYYEDFRHIEFHSLLANLYSEQGRAERIKNFPFPRQYASTALWLTIVFAAFVPFGMTTMFDHDDVLGYFIMPFLSGLVIWIFFLMEKIGDYSENPFEGSYNDVPITSITRGIEIDLLEMIDDENVPSTTPTEQGFLL